MIRTSLEFIKKELEAYIVEREQDPANYSAGNIVELKPLIKPTGELNVTDTSHVTIMMAGVEEERREGKRPYYVPTDDKQFMRLNPPVELDLLVLFIAHNGHYETALRDLSDVASFFQANPVFDQQRYPALNASVTDPVNKPWQLIERLTFKLYNLSFEQQNNLWAMLGGKYFPSLVYKMNMLTVFDTKGKDKTPGIKELNFKEN
ncbi:MAG TPA: DUF4255 domain-containing protein [Chitinophaga sp.]|uniref:DUF4255 domain-containing protein n=1 Tax=Chitinophaga sp. TaxID=1869181 RepID=UPI002F94D7E1